METSVAAAVPKQEIKREDYQAPTLEIKHVDLVFRLYAEYAEVVAVSQIEMRPNSSGEVVLDGGPYMDLMSVSLDGMPVAEELYSKSADQLVLSAVPDRFELKIVTKLKPKENTRLEGLYFSGGNFCTQCEAEGFRHITYFPDRPDILTVYDVRIEADKKTCPILLSNGNPGQSGDLENDRHYAEWHDPHLKPSYLFALVAGDLACVSDSYRTQSGKKVSLNIFVAENDLDKCGYAMESLKRSMHWDEQVYGLEYDLEVYNIVAVADFNMGAMENKGLNIFNTKYVLASRETATDADFDHVEGVIGHEYFHNWTGNRVTCRDWFQLSLKEGLTVFRDQEFSSDMTSRAVKRLDDVRVLRMLQFPEDSGPLAHPVRPEKYIEINNFYTTTVYNKGAEVIRMMHRIIGADAFKRGMKVYFEKHDGTAATCEDFVAAMEAASGADLKQFRHWYSQAGTPKLKISKHRDGDDLVLEIEQSSLPSPGQPIKHHYHMPVVVGLVGANGQNIRASLTGEGRWTDEGCVLNLRQSKQSFRFEGVPADVVPSLLRGFSAPVNLEHDLTPEDLNFLAANDSDPFVRWETAQDIYSNYLLNAMKANGANEQTNTQIGEMFLNHLKDENTDPALIAELLALPSEVTLGQKMKILDSEGIHSVREELSDKFARTYSSEIMERYCQLQSSSSFSLKQTEKARRRLRNSLLTYVVRLPEGEALALAHYSDADNMTDRMAALTQIAHSDFQCRTEVLAQFYNEWQDNDLVIDKWFGVQALSKRPDTVDAVQRLTGHPAFNFQNPNRLRSLVSTFSMLNQIHFHHKSGAGYAFLAKMISRVDQINPQTAARLVPPLGRWERVSEGRRKHMKAALKSILKSGQVSDDVRELVQKSLG